MLKKVTDAILQFSFNKNTNHITVALSGGADSMALLDVLLSLKDDLGIKKISAAHFNHQIRGAEAVRDQEFVVSQCKNRDVELYLGSADVVAYAKQNRLSVELAARKLRYEFFGTIKTDAIATAHTASDNIETVIFNLTRGTALSGLCGIPPTRERYIRPLIFCTRTDVEIYCRQNNIEYVTDSTNLCDDYTRNKIRHKIIPVLKTVNPSAETAVSRMTASLREDESFINSVATDEYLRRQNNNALSLNDFNKLHPAIAKRVIVKFLNDNNINFNNFHINQVYGICISTGKISLPDNKAAVSGDNILKIESAQKSQSIINFKVDMQVAQNDLFKNCQKVHNLLLKNILDYDKIVGQPIVRNRQIGDTIKLKNKNCTKTLKKLFCEYKIPQQCRQDWPVIADDNGVIWIYKIGVADRCATDCCSKTICKISVTESF